MNINTNEMENVYIPKSATPNLFAENITKINYNGFVRKLAITSQEIFSNIPLFNCSFLKYI